MHGRNAVRILVALVALSSCACLEEVVQERMTIQIDEKAGAQVTLTTWIKSGERDGIGRRERQRLDEVRGTLVHGDDEWTRRIRAAEPVEDATLFVRRDGELREVRRTLRVDDLRDLEALFEGTDVDLAVEVSEETTELAFYADRSRRATMRQRELLDEALDEWCAAMKTYLVAMQDVFELIDDDPNRARIVWGALLEDALEPDTVATLDEPNETEQAVLDRAEQAMLDVLGIFSVPEGGDATYEELSALAHDPFPAPLALLLPAEPLEVEGFEELGSQRLTVPGLSLWRAWRGLSDEVLRPDPMTPLVEHHLLRRDAAPVDLEATVRAPRHVDPKSERELRELVELWLTPESVYRVSWPSSAESG